MAHKAAWTPVYWDDWLGDTQDLSLLEHGAYFRLMAAYYANNGHLPADNRRLYRVTGALEAEEQEAVDLIVARFFGSDGHQLTHRRADTELAKIAEKRQQAQAAAARRHADEDAEAPAGGGADAPADASTEQPASAPATRARGPQPTPHTPQSKSDTPEPSSQNSPPEKDAPAPSGAGRATRTTPHAIPEDWWPNATNLRWLQQAGVSDTDQVAIIDEFKRWAANSGHKRANWDLTFGRNPAVKSAVGRARTNGGAAEKPANGADPWSVLTRHVKDGHRLSDVEADDPALAATVQELGGMRRLRDMTERDFAFLERKFRETYRRKSAEP